MGGRAARHDRALGAEAGLALKTRLPPPPQRLLWNRPELVGPTNRGGTSARPLPSGHGGSAGQETHLAGGGLDSSRRPDLEPF